MKKVLLSLITLCLFAIGAKAQGIPTKHLNYQAVIRNNSGDVIANQFVSLRFGIFQDTLPVAILPVFQEVHVTKTNAFGQVNVVIGKGASTYGIYDTLSWKGKYRYLKIELDADGGTVFKKMGYAQFQTVPYAQVALDVINKPALGELTNVNTTGAAAGQVLKFNGTNWTPATDATSGGGGGGSDNQTLSLTGTQLSISNGNSVTLPTGATYSAGSGISISGSTISNTGDTNAADDLTTSSSANGDVLGSFNDLKVIKIYNYPVKPNAPVFNDVLKWDGTAWKPSADATGGGGGTTYAAGTGITISGSTISNNGDLSNTNEIQALSLAGATLSLSNGGGSVTLPTGTTYSAGSGINIAGNTITATDNSATNEIQTLSLAGTTLSLSNGGGSVTLPAGGGGSLNGSGTVGSLTRWTSANTLGDAAIQQDIESNLGVNTIPQTAYKMRIKSTLPSQFPLEILGNNVPGAGIQFTLNDAAQNAEIRVQSAVTNFRTTSDKLALNARSASLFPLMADHLQIRSNGSVTMGLFDPMSSSDLLSVRGNIGIKDGSYNFYNNSNVATADISCIEPSNKLHIHSISSGAGIEIVSTGGKIELATNGIGGASSEMVVENGKVTVGVTGAATQPKLEVNGQVKINGGTPGAGKVLTSDATGLATWQNSPVVGSQWSLSGIGVTNANPTTSVHIKTSATEALRIEGGPSAYTSIYESGNYRGYMGSYSGDDADVDFGTGGGSGAKTHLVTSATPRLTVDATGNVGIGTTSPNEKLDVDGKVLLRVSPLTNLSGIIQRTSSDEFAFGGALTSNFNSVDALGSSTRRWTTVFALNGIINTSDRREKKNIEPLNYGLNEVMKLKPVTFNWKDREDGKKIGFIAQELQEVISEVVVDTEYTKNRDGSMTSKPMERLGVYYSDIIPVLTKAIQEQQVMIEELKKEVAALKAKK
jgi:hypothetical protein